MSDNVDLDVVARSTSGFAGAELANIVNEAAMLAARYVLYKNSRSRKEGRGKRDGKVTFRYRAIAKTKARAKTAYEKCIPSYWPPLEEISASAC